MSLAIWEKLQNLSLTICFKILSKVLCLIFSGSLLHIEGPKYDCTEFKPLLVLRKFI